MQFKSHINITNCTTQSHRAVHTNHIPIRFINTFITHVYITTQSCAVWITFYYWTTLSVTSSGNSDESLLKQLNEKLFLAPLLKKEKKRPNHFLSHLGYVLNFPASLLPLLSRTLLAFNGSAMAGTPALTMVLLSFRSPLKSESVSLSSDRVSSFLSLFLIVYECHTRRTKHILIRFMLLHGFVVQFNHILILILLMYDTVFSCRKGSLFLSCFYFLLCVPFSFFQHFKLLAADFSRPCRFCSLMSGPSISQLASWAGQRVVVQGARRGRWRTRTPT